MQHYGKIFIFHIELTQKKALVNQFSTFKQKGSYIKENYNFVEIGLFVCLYVSILGFLYVNKAFLCVSFGVETNVDKSHLPTVWKFQILFGFSLQVAVLYFLYQGDLWISRRRHDIQ